MSLNKTKLMCGLWFLVLGLTACTTTPEEIDNTDARRRASIRLQLASAYLEAEQAAVALNEVKEAIAIDPTVPEAYHLRALSYMKLSENALADQSFRRAIELRKNDGDLLSNYGWFLCTVEKYDEALPYFDQAMRSPSASGPAKPMANAGICSLKRGNLAAAESYLTRATQYDYNNPVAISGLAQLYYKQRKFDVAWSYIQRINAGPQSSAESLWLGARIAHELGDRDQQDFLATQLRRRFASSREVGALERGAWNE